MATKRSLPSRSSLTALGTLVATIVAASALLGWPPSTWAVHSGQATLDIASERDITITGVDPDDRSGFGVAAGDLNNDAFEDLIIGAYLADPDGRTNAGQTYVLFGPVATGTLALSPTTADVIVNGIDPGDMTCA